MDLMLKKFDWNIAQYSKPVSRVIQRANLNALNGSQSLYKKMKPEIPVKKTTKLETTSSGKLKAYLNISTIITLKTTVKAAGRLLPITFIRKLPLTMSVLGSNARMNDGIPIVNVVISVSWIGMKKYLLPRMIHSSTSNIVKIVFTNSRDALLSMLLMVLLPSATI